MTQPPRLWVWIMWPAAAMALGWGLRGFIGGGPLGAMIPGAMIALVVSLLLRRDGADAGLIAAAGAAGIGFGGQETYGQTVGLSLVPETHGWALLGFAIKGAVWGLLGGVVLGMALLRAVRGYRLRFLAAGLAWMTAGTWLGWRLVNAPKLIYFSNRFDKPREELWAGLLLGALCLLGWLWRAGGVGVARRFALWGALGGGAGFALGAAVQAWGRHSDPLPWLDWWKVMELIFGALLGAAYGYAAWTCRGDCGPAGEARTEGWPLWRQLAAAAALVVFAGAVEDGLPLRCSYTAAGAVLLTAALWRETLAWHTAISVTAAAFLIDLVKARPVFGVEGSWAAASLCAAAVAVAVARRAAPRSMFLLLTWSATGVSLLKVYLPPANATAGGFVMEAAFVALAAAVTLFSRAESAPRSG